MNLIRSKIGVQSPTFISVVDENLVAGSRNAVESTILYINSVINTVVVLNGDSTLATKVAVESTTNNVVNYARSILVDKDTL